MAQSETPSTRPKRGASRLSKEVQPVEKKRKISVALPQSPAESAPASPVPPPTPKPTRLPIKIVDSRPLPTLPERQPTSLSDNEYQSLAASAVLQSSLDRSRLKWTCEGIFERYWVKPETGKNAKPTPPNNPELKWQKHKGPCRIRIEPHILETEIYVEEKAKPPPPPVKQYVRPNYGYNPTGGPYHPPQPYHQSQQHYHGRPMPQQPGQHYQSPAHGSPNTLPPINNMQHQSSPAQQSPRPPQSPSQPPPEKKGLPDPVISMLANRASSDPELKALMKEVATGNATQAQLKIFQGHIDELTKIINDKKEKEEREATSTAAATAPPPQQPEVIQYDGAADTPPRPQQRQWSQPYQQPAPTHYPPPQQHTWSVAPTPPTALPVILAFTNPGATEDRFLFPQTCIIESLSPQHLLCSFIITRFGRDAIDPSLLDPDTEYWQPITLMVEVAYNREHLLDCVRRWVKPAEEVKKAMEEVMGRAKKAPEGFLAMRLPFKGSAVAEVEEVGVSGPGTPVEGLEERGKGKGAAKAAKVAVRA